MDRKQWQRERVLSGKQAEADARHKPRRKSWGNGTARKTAHNRARKYGMTLPQMERMGWIPPDVQEALDHADRSE